MLKKNIKKIDDAKFISPKDYTKTFFNNLEKLSEVKSAKKSFNSEAQKFSKKEIQHFYSKLNKGEIEGTSYYGTANGCCCFYGTLYKFRYKKPGKFSDIKSKFDNPTSLDSNKMLIEDFVFRITEYDTPKNNIYAALVAKWCEEWLTKKT